MTESQNGLIDRASFARVLDETSKLGNGTTRLRGVIRDLLIRDGLDVVDTDEELVMAIVYRLDATEDDAALVDLASSYARFLHQGIPTVQSVLLVPLVDDRRRLTELLDKLAQGTLTRASFESYLTEQRWSHEVKRAIRLLPKSGLEHLRNALAGEEYDTAASLLFS